MNEPLFVGESICLAPIDPGKDAEIEAQWSHDSYYLRLLGREPALPRTAAQVKEQYESLEKEMDERKTAFNFAIRTRAENRLAGFVRLFRIDWPHRSAHIQLAIGDPLDRRQGYGAQALQLVLRYAFDETNLNRLSAAIPAYNSIATDLFLGAGFVEEIRQREAIQRAGKRWDLVTLGLLQGEWRLGA